MSSAGGAVVIGMDPHKRSATIEVMDAADGVGADADERRKIGCGP
jgi:hypothetical protein